MINFEHASQLIKKEFLDLNIDTEYVKLEDALNRTLAENIFADVNLPSFNNSAVDGIAISFYENIRKWEISDEVSAGNYFDISKGESVLIMTGAKLPAQFDTVIPLEDYTVTDNKARLNDNIIIRKGINIRPKASDVAAGDLVVKQNSFLSPRNIAAIAACGKSNLNVYKKLNIGILATGDELIPIEEKPTRDKVRVSNNYGLTSAVQSVFQNGFNHGYVNDDYNIAKEKIKKIMESDIDIIITTGGVSVGKYDYVREIFNELGVEEIFWRANIKPGKPAFFGKNTNGEKIKLIFGLPGNPVSCMVNFDVYIKPNISARFGLNQQTRIKATLVNDIRKKDSKRHFVRGEINHINGNYSVTSQLSQSSGNLVQFSSSNCLIELSEEVRNPQKGALVECILI